LIAAKRPKEALSELSPVLETEEYSDKPSINLLVSKIYFYLDDYTGAERYLKMLPRLSTSYDLQEDQGIILNGLVVLSKSSSNNSERFLAKNNILASIQKHSSFWKGIICSNELNRFENYEKEIATLKVQAPEIVTSYCACFDRCLK
jgi:hypothetical protein